MAKLIQEAWLDRSPPNGWRGFVMGRMYARSGKHIGWYVAIPREWQLAPRHRWLLAMSFAA